MRFDPMDIGYLYYLSKEELGDLSLTGLIGATLEEVKVGFKPHDNYKVQRLWR
jgi:hypothetical protein